MKAKPFHMPGIMAVTLLAGLAMGIPVQAEDILDNTQFQLVIRQGSVHTNSVSFAFGHGSDVQFYSNLDEFGMGEVETDENGFSVRRLGPGDADRPVMLGVCAGGNCEEGTGNAFTSSVGAAQ